MNKNRNHCLISTVICDLAAGEADTFPVLAASLKHDTFFASFGPFPWILLFQHQKQLQQSQQLQNADSWLALLGLRKGKKESICN